MGMTLPPDVEIRSLHEVPEHRLTVASLIHHEFWTAVPGASVETMAARLSRARSLHELPLCLVALCAGQVCGVVNLVDNDDEDHADWHPWLAGMVVSEPWRGQGIGSALVRTLLDHARRLGYRRVHFGTDGPGFYARLGAVEHQVPRPGFWFMRFDLDPPAA